MKLLIPFICAVLFRLGGWGKYKFMWCMPAKWYRWLGIGICLTAYTGNLWLILTYYIATNVPYGDNSWLRRIVGRDMCWVIYGFLFGLASFPALGWAAVSQGLLASFTFWYLMGMSNDGYGDWYLDHKWVEIWTGFTGTLLYWFA